MVASPLVALLVCAAPAADAPPSPWHLAVEAGTSFPIDVGARATVEGPYRLQASLGAGFIPGGYVDVINSSLVSLNAYDQATANLIHTALQSSLLVHLQLGWRPFASHGFYVHAGYAVGVLGGGLSLASALVAASKTQAQVQDTDTFEVAAHVQAVELEVGWTWTLPHDLQLRAGVGGLHTFASSTSVTLKNATDRREPGIAALEQGAGAYLDSTITTYVYSPAVTVTVGYLPF